MNTPASVSIEKISETELFSFLTGVSSAHELPLALWRLPHADTKHLIISHQHQKLSKEFSLEEMSAGFMFAPFDKEKEACFLPGDYIFSFEKNSLKNPESPVEISSAAWLNKQLNQHPEGLRFKPLLQAKRPVKQGKKSDYMALVNTCIAEIEKGTFEKVVPSRTKRIELSQDFDVIKTFQKICQIYPHALVSFVNMPGQGSWLGATPEMLVSVEDKTIFRTVALAGTKPYQHGMNLKSIAWTQKEIEEQALVERYIISCFKKIRLREYEEHGPKTVVAGNLVHLQSDFKVDMKTAKFPQLGSVMLQLLHPTSAVCGMPLNSAMEFLKNHEGYNREFYAGYLGPVNINRTIDIFVNIRCLQLLEKEAILYAGAGVTVDSVAEQEWEETEIKFNTLLNVIA